MAIVIPAAILLYVVMRIINAPDDRAGKRDADAAVPVTVAAATVEDLEIWRSGVGSVRPLEVVDVKARVDGQVTRIDFDEGREVRKGDILAQLDPRPYQALLAQAVAIKTRDAAQLNNSRLNLDRANSLARRGFITAQAVDALKAEVATSNATLAGDQAQIDTARLNLEFATVRSPISGRAGIRQVNTGATVRNNDATGIVTITQMAPIGAVFSLPQDDLARIGNAAGHATVTAFGRDGTTRLAQGTLGAVDSQVDSTNGRVRLKAIFTNADRKLWPGELVTIRLLSHVLPGAVVVPAVAVQMSQSGPFVYVLRKDRTVAATPVRTGEAVAGKIAVLHGVRAGDRVVVAGHSRITDGAKVDAKRIDTRP